LAGGHGLALQIRTAPVAMLAPPQARRLGQAGGGLGKEAVNTDGIALAAKSSGMWECGDFIGGTLQIETVSLRRGQGSDLRLGSRFSTFGRSRDGQVEIYRLIRLRLTCLTTTHRDSPFLTRRTR